VIGDLARHDRATWNGVALEVGVVDLSQKSVRTLLSFQTLLRLTLAVYPGSVLLKAPGIDSEGFQPELATPPVTLS